MVRASKSAKPKSAKSFLWMRKKGRKIAKEAQSLKHHQRMKKRYADLMANSEKNEAKAMQNIAESRRIYQKHKASSAKNIITAENCLVRFVLNTHPALVESAFSEHIMGCLNSDNLKCLKQTNKSMCLHVDENCNTAYNFYYVRDPVTRNYRKAYKTSLSLVQ